MSGVEFPTALYLFGQLVQKRKGSRWRGRVVGFYTTCLTNIGYAVESIYEPGSVQIYPEAHLEPFRPEDALHSENRQAQGLPFEAS